MMWYCGVGLLVRSHSSDDVCSYRSRPESPVLYCCRLWWFCPLDCWQVTKCSHAWSFLQQCLVVQSNSVAIFIFVFDTKLSFCSQYVVFYYVIFSFQMWLDLFFLPMPVLFVRQPVTEEWTGYIVSSQSGCAWTTIRTSQITRSSC